MRHLQPVSVTFSKKCDLYIYKILNQVYKKLDSSYNHLSNVTNPDENTFALDSLVSLVTIYLVKYVVKMDIVSYLK